MFDSERFCQGATYEHGQLSRGSRQLYSCDTEKVPKTDEPKTALAGLCPDLHFPSHSKYGLLSMRPVGSPVSLALSAALTVLCVHKTVAQAIQGDTTGVGWTVASIAHADLWFHGLAILGLQGIGPLPLYDPDYVTRITEEKQRRGVYPTKLDEIGADLAENLSRFDLEDFVHFVPLYFPAVGREEFFVGLQDIARDRWDSGLVSDGMVPGGNLLSAVVQGSRERRALLTLLDALTEEWELFYQYYWRESVSARLPQIQTIQFTWDRYFEPKLRPFLQEQNLSEGVVAVSPSLGFEGRVVQGEPFVLAAAVPILDNEEHIGFTPLFLLKELCYLAMDEVVAGVDESDVEKYERLRRNLAVRCGDILLEHYMPEATDAYRETFLLPYHAASSPHLDFEELYQVSEELLIRMRSELTGRSN